MRIPQIVRHMWARFESFTYALDHALEYDQCTELRSRVARLERVVADIEGANR